MQGQGSGVAPVSSQRRDRVIPSKHQGGKLGQIPDGPRDPNGRVSTPKAGEDHSAKFLYDPFFSINHEPF